MARIGVLYSALGPLPHPVSMPEAGWSQPPTGLVSRADNERVARLAARTLQKRGHDVCVVGAWDRVPVEHMRDLQAVLNLCEGLEGHSSREAEAPEQMDAAGIRYSGSSAETLRLCQRKERCRARLQEAGVPVAPGLALQEVPKAWPEVLGKKCIVKPAWEDASEGIDAAQVATTLSDLQEAVRKVLVMNQPALCETFIDGREFTASVLGTPPRVLPLGEIDFTRMLPGQPHIVSYAAKWDPASPEYQNTPSVDSKLDPSATGRAMEIARKAAGALGLRDIARLDMRMNGQGEFFVIDVNPNCDLSDDAGFAKAGYRAGLTYPEILEAVLARALSK